MIRATKTKLLSLGAVLVAALTLSAVACSVFGGDDVKAKVAGVGFITDTVSAEAQATGPRSVFPATTREIRAIVVIDGAKAGMKVSSRWYQLGPTNAGPEGSLINSAELILGAADIQANGRATPSFTQRNQSGPLPEDNWVLRVYIDGDLARTAGFTITRAFAVAPPGPTVAPPPPPAPTPVAYTVASGDTLQTVAQRFLPPGENLQNFVTRIAQFNNITPTTTLQTGQTLRIPPPLP